MDKHGFKGDYDTCFHLETIIVLNFKNILDLKLINNIFLT